MSIVGRLTNIRICSTIGNSSVALALGTVGVFVVMGLFRLGWQKVANHRKNDNN